MRIEPGKDPYRFENKPSEKTLRAENMPKEGDETAEKQAAIASKSTPSPEAIKDQVAILLKALGLNPTPERQTALEALMTARMPVDVPSVSVLVKSMHQFPETDIKVFTTLIQHDMPITKDHVMLMTAFLNQDPLMTPSLNQVMDQIVLHLMNETPMDPGVLEILTADAAPTTTTATITTTTMVDAGSPVMTLDGQQMVRSETVVQQVQSQVVAQQVETQAVQQKGQTQESQQPPPQQPVPQEPAQSLAQVQKEAAVLTGGIQETAVLTGDKQQGVAVTDANANQEAVALTEGKQQAVVLTEGKQQAVMAAVDTLVKEGKMDPLPKDTALNKALIQTVVERRMLLTLEAMASKDGVKSYFKTLMRTLEGLKTSDVMGGNEGEKPASQQVQSAIRFMDSMQRQLPFLELPLWLQHQEKTMQVYVFGHKKNKHQDGRHASVLLQLDFLNLGHLDIYVAKQEKAMTIQFYLDDPKKKALIDTAINGLYDQLTPFEFQPVAIQTVLRQGDLDPVSQILQQEPGIQLKQVTFDQKV